MAYIDARGSDAVELTYLRVQWIAKNSRWEWVYADNTMLWVGHITNGVVKVVVGAQIDSLGDDPVGPVTTDELLDLFDA